MSLFAVVAFASFVAVVGAVDVVSNIVPGGTGAGKYPDVWPFGATRTISFTVNSLPAGVDRLVVNIVDLNENSDCKTLSVSQLYSDDDYREVVARGDISDFSKAGTAPFDVKIPWTLGGKECVDASDDMAIEVVLYSGGDVQQKVLGRKFKAQYNLCYVDGRHGRCMSREQCVSDAKNPPWILPNSSVDPCVGLSKQNPSACCIPNYAGWKRMFFIAGSKVPLGTNDSYRHNLACPTLKGDASVRLSYELCRYPPNVVTVAANFFSPCTPVHARQELPAGVTYDSLFSSPSGTPMVPVVSDSEPFIDGRWYSLMVRTDRTECGEFTTGMYKMRMEVSGCYSSSTETVVGQCIPQDECPGDRDVKDGAKYCPGLVAGGGRKIVCCAVPRRLMSNGFFEEAPEELEAVASVRVLSIVALVAIAVALLI